MKAHKRFIILLLLVVFMGVGYSQKSEASEIRKDSQIISVSMVNFGTTARYNIHQYHGGVFNQHFNYVVQNLKEEEKLIKVLTFITSVKGETTIEHKIYYSTNSKVKEKPFHKIFFISSSPDDGEKYFLNLCFEYEYVNLVNFGFTPNGLRMFVFETNI